MGSSDKSPGRTTTLEFGGVPGAVAMVVGLPVGVYTINLACGESGCHVLPLPALPRLSDLWDTTAAGIVIAWVLFQVRGHFCVISYFCLFVYSY